MDCFMTKSSLVSTQLPDGEVIYCCEECFGLEAIESLSKSSRIKPINKVQEMVKEMLTFMPQMAFIPNREGDYPLHIAINNQQSYQVAHEIFKAFPVIGTIHDTKTSLLPFMLAAVDNWRNETDQLTTTYQLLREDPC